jgi:hypothetical protein
LQDRLFPFYVNVTSFFRIPGVPSLGHGFPLLAPRVILADYSSVDAVSGSDFPEFDIFADDIVELPVL